MTFKITRLDKHRNFPGMVTGPTVIFFREDGFYPVVLSGLRPVAIEVADHAELNPGTLRIEDIAGNILWPEGTKQ